MAKDYSKQISKQIGENLTVAKLGEQGFIATAFAGNVPDFDVLAYDNKSGKKFSIQVKAVRGGSISYSDAQDFIVIKKRGKTQSVTGINKELDKNLICVFVWIGKELCDSRFYILKQGDLARIIHDNYSAYLREKGGVRPRNPGSTHVAVAEEHFKKYKDNWKCLK